MRPRMLIVIAVLFCSGCGSELASIGGGIVAGGALSHTLTGAEKDLEVREAGLIELYNKGVEDGAQKEYLDQIEKDIYDTRLGKQTVQTGKKLFNVDWQDPKAAGGAISLIATLAYGYIKRKDLIDMGKKYKSHKQGAAKFMRENNDGTGKKLYENIAEARKINKIA